MRPEFGHLPVAVSDTWDFPVNPSFHRCIRTFTVTQYIEHHVYTYALSRVVLTCQTKKRKQKTKQKTQFKG